MAESNTGNDTEAAKSWYTKLLDKAVTGTAIQASPVWMVPDRILIAKVWDVSNEKDFIWTLSVDKLISDHIAGSLAASPREVARHFSMKWQMDADRVANFGQANAADDKTREQMQAYSNQLIQQAELLYDLSGRDGIWEEQQSFDS